jgi:Ca2+-binding RTX toxin-like protein
MSTINGGHYHPLHHAGRAGRPDGYDGDDLVSGDAANDIVYGEGGNDTLEGGIGADQLFGGAGADTLVGGLGADLVFGGTGANVFTYGALNESTMTGVDIIADFDQGKDRIDLTALLITSDVVEITVANGVTDIEVKGTALRSGLKRMATMAGM